MIGHKAHKAAILLGSCVIMEPTLTSGIRLMTASTAYTSKFGDPRTHVHTARRNNAFRQIEYIDGIQGGTALPDDRRWIEYINGSRPDLPEPILEAEACTEAEPILEATCFPEAEACTEAEALLVKYDTSLISDDLSKNGLENYQRRIMIDMVQNRKSSLDLETLECPDGDAYEKSRKNIDSILSIESNGGEMNKTFRRAAAGELLEGLLATFFLMQRAEQPLSAGLQHFKKKISGWYERKILLFKRLNAVSGLDKRGIVDTIVDVLKIVEAHRDDERETRIRMSGNNFLEYQVLTPILRVYKKHHENNNIKEQLYSYLTRSSGETNIFGQLWIHEDSDYERLTKWHLATYEDLKRSARENLQKSLVNNVDIA